MLKKIGLSIAAIFLLGQSYKLFFALEKMDIDSIGLNILAAWLINLFITGIFAFSGFAFPTQKLMPEAYYKIRNPKRLKKIYKASHTELFRKFLLATLWKNQDQRNKFFDGTRTGISNLIRQSKKSEFGHLIPLIILFFVSIYFLSIGRITLSVWTFVINIIGNLYPIILQRHHRMRIQILYRRLSK